MFHKFIEKKKLGYFITLTNTQKTHLKHFSYRVQKTKEVF